MPRRKKIVTTIREWILNDGTKIRIEGPSANRIVATGESISIATEKSPRFVNMVVDADRGGFLGSPPPAAGQVYTRGLTGGLGSDRPQLVREESTDPDLEEFGLDAEAVEKMTGGL